MNVKFSQLKKMKTTFKEFGYKYKLNNQTQKFLKKLLPDGKDFCWKKIEIFANMCNFIYSEKKLFL